MISYYGQNSLRPNNLSFVSILYCAQKSLRLVTRSLHPSMQKKTRSAENSNGIFC